nr:hypothetical protein Iba_chr05fCG12310 [Ipomoea batatas]
MKTATSDMKRIRVELARNEAFYVQMAAGAVATEGFDLPLPWLCHGMRCFYERCCYEACESRVCSLWYGL